MFPRVWENGGVARLLIVIGVGFVVAGALVMLGDRVGVRIGRLPGDFVFRGRNTTFYFPLVTCLLLSLLLTLIGWLVNRR